ncbi:MAG: hypothetical protein LBK66_01050 [Spirochaetaceae bacterium]|nr:hypothetical protein [Spirochaetaceae bacterium]
MGDDTSWKKGPQIMLGMMSEICIPFGVICGHYEYVHPEGVRRSAQGGVNPADLFLEGRGLAQQYRL